MDSTDIEKLTKEWEADAKINPTEYATELCRIPNLHSKYAGKLANYSAALDKVNMTYAKMKRLKLDYYNGRLSKEQLDRLGWSPFVLNVKYDMQAYLEGDEHLSQVDLDRKLHERAIKFCESVIKELQNRTWQIKTAADWEKFLAGQ